MVETMNVTSQALPWHELIGHEIVLGRDFLTWELWLLRRFMNGLGSPMNPWDCIENRCHDQLVEHLYSGLWPSDSHGVHDPHKFNQ